MAKCSYIKVDDKRDKQNKGKQKNDKLRNFNVRCNKYLKPQWF